MKEENLVVDNIVKLGIAYKTFSVKDTFIESINNNGIRWLDLYTICEDIETKERKKIKIRIDGSSYVFSEVDEDEWDRHCKSNT